MKAFDIIVPTEPAVVDIRFTLEECQFLTKTCGYYFSHRKDLSIGELDDAHSMYEAFNFISETLKKDEVERLAARL